MLLLVERIAGGVCRAALRWCSRELGRYGLLVKHGQGERFDEMVVNLIV
jgi:hypothetical protein